MATLRGRGTCPHRPLIACCRYFHHKATAPCCRPSCVSEPGIKNGVVFAPFDYGYWDTGRQPPYRSEAAESLGWRQTGSSAPGAKTLVRFRRASLVATVRLAPVRPRTYRPTDGER
jgi:hypothetical protein